MGRMDLIGCWQVFGFLVHRGILMGYPKGVLVILSIGLLALMLFSSAWQSLLALSATGQNSSGQS